MSEININGIIISAMPINKILEFANKQVLKDYYEQIREISKDNKFAIDAAINAPKGAKLDELGFEWIYSVNGLCKLVDYAIKYNDSKVDQKKIDEILETLIKNKEENKTNNLKNIIDIIMGVDEVEEKKSSI